MTGTRPAADDPGERDPSAVGPAGGHSAVPGRTGRSDTGAHPTSLAELTSLQGSATLAAAASCSSTGQAVLPAGTRRTDAGGRRPGRGERRSPARPRRAGVAATEVGSDPLRADPGQLAAEYRRWRNQHEPGPDAARRAPTGQLAWERRPLVSVVLPVARRRPEVARRIDRLGRSAGLRPVGADRRRRSLPSGPTSTGSWNGTSPPTPGSGSSSSGRAAGRTTTTVPAQRAAAQADGEWVVRLDAGDLLRPDALHRLVEHASAHGDDDVVYADEDRLLAGGRSRATRAQTRLVARVPAVEGLPGSVPPPYGAACSRRWAGGARATAPRRTTTCTCGPPSTPERRSCGRGALEPANAARPDRRAARADRTRQPGDRRTPTPKADRAGSGCGRDAGGDDLLRRPLPGRGRSIGRHHHPHPGPGRPAG